MDYPILSYHSHSFLEQLRRHFQNLDTFLNEILPIDEEKFYFLDEHDNRFIHDGVENLLERLRQRLDHQTKERYINEVSEILHVLDKCFSLEGNYGPYDSLSDYDRKNLQNLLFNRIAKFLGRLGNVTVLEFLSFHNSMMHMWQSIEMTTYGDWRYFNTIVSLFSKGKTLINDGIDYGLFGILRLLAITDSLAAKFHVVDYISALSGYQSYHIPRIFWETNRKKKIHAMDTLLDGIKYADLAYTIPAKSVDIANGISADVYLERYKLDFKSKGGIDICGKQHLPGNLNTYVAYRDEDINKAIYVGFAGTEDIHNLITDLRQFFFGPDKIYTLALGIVQSVSDSGARRHKFKDFPINVYGHSLGGGLMQYSIANSTANNIFGYGYNSAGLGIKTMNNCRFNHIDDISHLYQPNDVIFKIPLTYQLGRAVKLSNTYHGIKKTHGLDVIRKSAEKYGDEIADFR